MIDKDEIEVFGTVMRRSSFLDTLGKFFGNYDFLITHKEEGDGRDSITINIPRGNAKKQDVE